jgi:predicted GIY-YIG superfamily endonuclease
MKGYVYILECCDGSFYVGKTANPFSRMRDHFTGRGAVFTRKRLPVKLVYITEVDDMKEAEWKLRSKVKRLGLDFILEYSKSSNTELHNKLANIA